MSRAWWLTPVIPALLEAKAGELFEPRRLWVAVSQDQATTLQPGQWSKTPSQTTTTKRKLKHCGIKVGIKKLTEYRTQKQIQKCMEI